MDVIVATSKISDGNMLARGDESNKQVISNRTSFLAKNGIDINHTTLVNINYDGDNYNRYYEVSEAHKSNGMLYDDIVAADALVTQVPGHALFLPVADCVGAVIFDPEKHILMLTHLGRHSLEQNGGYQSVEFLKRHYNCEPSKLKIWLTPAPDSDVYPLHIFHNRSLKNVIFDQLQTNGVLQKNIHDNPADTTRDPDYFSHSDFLKGNQTKDGRYAIVAMMQLDN